MPAVGRDIDDLWPFVDISEDSAKLLSRMIECSFHNMVNCLIRKGNDWGFVIYVLKHPNGKYMMEVSYHPTGDCFHEIMYRNGRFIFFEDVKDCLQFLDDVRVSYAYDPNKMYESDRTRW